MHPWRPRRKRVSYRLIRFFKRSNCAVWTSQYYVGGWPSRLDCNSRGIGFGLRERNSEPIGASSELANVVHSDWPTNIDFPRRLLSSRRSGKLIEFTRSRDAGALRNPAPADSRPPISACSHKCRWITRNLSPSWQNNETLCEIMLT